ncbi:hypothetical protein D3C74_504080 [compost metagenome]
MLITGGIFTLMIKIPVVGIIAAPVVISMLSTAVYVLMKAKETNPNIAPAIENKDQLDT